MNELTPNLISKLIKQYKQDVINFNQFKDEINNILLSPIYWYHCSFIKSFEVYSDKLVINAITYNNNNCIATINF